MTDPSDNPRHPERGSDARPDARREGDPARAAGSEADEGGQNPAPAGEGDGTLPTEGYELAEPSAKAPGPGQRATEAPHTEPAATTGSSTPTTAPATTSATASPAAPPKRDRAESKQVLSNPPRQRVRLTAWLVMLVCLLIALVPMAVDLGRPAVIHEHEARTLATSAQTWAQQAQWTYADRFFETLVPTYNEQPQLDSTPGTTWLHLLAFRAFGESATHASTAQLVLASRVVSLLCGLVTVAAIFWIGLTIGSLRTATLAALVCAAHPLLLYHSRLAGPELPRIATMVLTVAAAVWAIAPLNMRGSLWRQGTGWLVCGLALGAAVLTGGLSHLPLIVVPLVLIFALYPHRLSHLMGLVAAAIIAVLVTTPWALYVHEQEPTAWQRWLGELVPGYFEHPAQLGELAWQRLLLLVAVTLPWTAWLVAGLLQPFSTSSAGARLRMLLGWMWFVPVALLLIGAPGEPTVSELLMVVPAAALLVGQVIRQFSDLSDEGRHTRMWRLLRWPHAFVLMFASVALPAAGHFQAGMVRAGWLPGPVALPMPAWYWLGLGAALMLVVILSMRFAERHHPGRAIAAWAVWVVLAVGFAAGPVARGPMMDSVFEPAGERVRQATSEGPVYWLGEAEALDARLVFYARRELRPVTADQLEPVEPESEPVFVLAPAGRTPPEAFESVRAFGSLDLRLWRAGTRAEEETREGETE